MASAGDGRYATLDITRGVAVMGILLMNIVAFGLIETAYFNPRAQGGADGIDLGVYLVNFVLFDGKMRGLFSFLFGASTLLVIDRAGAKGENPARVHYLRMVWLLAFGFAHLYLIWWGDILTHYALIGMIAYLFRNLKVKTLIIVGIGLLVLEMLLLAGLPLGVLGAKAGLADPETARESAKTLQELNKGFGIPTTEYLNTYLANYRGSYGAVLAARWAAHAWSPITTFAFIGAETLAYMLFGMAALRSGMLTGEWARRRYVKYAAIGFGIGIPVYTALGAYMVANDFSLLSVTTGVMAATAPVRPLMIVAWACLIILLARPGGTLTDRIAAAGRMAFTNYLATSLICTTLFYGYGLGWFGYLSRAELYLVVLGMWALMLLWSKPWLDRFAYGPFEWLWRSLARLKLQPMRRNIGLASVSQYP